MASFYSDFLKQIALALPLVKSTVVCYICKIQVPINFQIEQIENVENKLF